MNFRSLSGAMAVFFEEPGEDFFGLYSKKSSCTSSSRTSMSATSTFTAPQRWMLRATSSAYVFNYACSYRNVLMLRNITGNETPN